MLAIGRFTGLLAGALKSIWKHAWVLAALCCTVAIALARATTATACTSGSALYFT